MRALLLDTETTSVDNPQVIELAYARIYEPCEDFLGWAFVTANTYRYCPSDPIQFGAMNTHHILPEDLEGCPSHTTKSVPPVDYWIGHNIDFDWKAMGSPNVKRICTLALCRRLWPQSDSHALGAMLYFLEGAVDSTRTRLRSAHSAAADIEINWTILQHILTRTGSRTLADLYVQSEAARIPETMAFGKHKGKRIEDVDTGYAQWYSKQPDTDPYLMEAFYRAGLLRRRQ